MKILVFYQYFGTSSGSWSTRFYELTRRWVRDGHDVTVVTAPYEKSDIKSTTLISRTTIDGIKLIVINSGDSNRFSFLKRAFNASMFAIISCKMALTESCDVVIASSGPISVGVPALMAKIIRGKKMIFEIRDLWPQGAIELGKINNHLMKSVSLWFEKLCYQNSSFVVACSTGMEESVNTRFPAVKTIVIPNASDTDLFKSVNKNYTIPVNLVDKKLFVYAGSLGLMDHGELMIKAMAHVHDTRIQLVIIGEGVERKSLEILASELNLRNVSFLGLKPKTELVLWLKSALAAIIVFKNYPVLQTSSPNKLFDAFAAGIPVIHNTTGWIKKLVDNSRCGLSVEPDSEYELAAAITKISGDKDYQKMLSENSTELGLTTFNREILAKKYLDALINL